MSLFRRLAIAYDGSEPARAALALGIALARDLGAELASLSIEAPLPRYAVSIGEVEEARERVEAHFRALTKEARDLAGLAGVELDAQVRRGGETEQILEFLREGRFDLLLLGAHGHPSMVDRLIGSTALSVARVAPCSVWLVRPRTRPRGEPDVPTHVCVGVDGSPAGRLALRVALELARLWGAEVTGVTVKERSPLAPASERLEREAAALGAAAAELARAAGVAWTHLIRDGHAARTLREVAQSLRADLLVVGATGLEHPWSPSLGGTAARVAAEASCSVLLVRPPQASLHVRDVMARPVVSVSPQTPLAEVVELLLRADVKALPVVDPEGAVIGIITGGDLLRRGVLRLRLGLKRELDPALLQARVRDLARGRQVARDVMTHPVHTVGPELDLAATMRVMATRGVKRLPVVEHGRRLVGIVSRADVLRALAALPEGPARGAPPLPIEAGTVEAAVIRDVPALAPATGAEEALRAVLASEWRRAVVVDDVGRPLGVITDRELLTRAAGGARRSILGWLGRGELPAGRELGGLTAADLMVRPALTVRARDSLVHAARLMMEYRVKRLVVVDDDGRLLGLIDRREVLRALARPAPPAGGEATR